MKKSVKIPVGAIVKISWTDIEMDRGVPKNIESELMGFVCSDEAQAEVEIKHGIKKLKIKELEIFK